MDDLIDQTQPKRGTQTGHARRFVMFFDQKEGTSPVMRLLHRFPGVEILHHPPGRGWEPFDRHNCGPMPLGALIECLDLVFYGASADKANRIYERTAKAPLAGYDTAATVGFKMRFEPPGDPRIPPGLGLLRRPIEARYRQRFSRAMIDLLRRRQVVVLLAVRQNLMRWALSKYHGDGTGRAGHIQFRLAGGELPREEIPRITVDPVRLERVIADCEAIHEAKERLAQQLQDAGVEVVPVRYEDFLRDQLAFFRRLMDRLDRRLTDEQISEVLDRGIALQRVHGDELSEFFVNADEIEARFGDRVRLWPGE